MRGHCGHLSSLPQDHRRASTSSQLPVKLLSLCQAGMLCVSCHCTRNLAVTCPPVNR